MNKFQATRKEMAKKYKPSDMAKVSEARAVLRKLRESGIKPKGYGLASPYGHKTRALKETGFRLK